MLKDYKNALAELNRAVELQPDDVNLQNRGWVLEVTGRYNDALTDYNELARLDPQDPWAHCHRAAILDKLGRAAEAIGDHALCSAARK